MSRTRIVDRVDFDEIWNNQKKGWKAWADEISVNPASLSEALRRAGWKRGTDRRLKEAPCRECGEGLKIEKLDPNRMCPECNRNRDPLYEKELKGYLQRHPHMMARVGDPPEGL